MKTMSVGIAPVKPLAQKPKQPSVIMVKQENNSVLTSTNFCAIMYPTMQHTHSER